MSWRLAPALLALLGWVVAALSCSGPTAVGPTKTIEVRPGTASSATHSATATTPTQEPTPVLTAVAAETPPPTETPVPTATPVPSTPVARPPADPPAPPRPPSRPESGRWIDVDVSRFVVTLMDGATQLRTIGPVAVGREVDTGVYNSTATGLFYVYSKTEGLAFDAPYDTYISHWVGFDPRLDNGFHSFLKDEAGNVVDASTGRVSNGCIRTGDPAAIFAFASIGMPVWVHA